MLGVVDHLASAFGDVGDALGDHGEVLGARCLKDRLNVQGPALAEDRDDRRLGIEEGIQVGVVARPVRLVTRAAERGESRTLPADLLRRREELNVLRIGAWPSTLNRQHAEFVERASDAQLVLQ